MLKFHTKYQPRTVSNASPLDIEHVRRFIVPVFDGETDFTAVMHRIWQLADTTGAYVQFIGMCRDAAQEPGLRRTLVTMSAMMNTGNVSGDAEIMVNKDWVYALKSRLQPGDMIVCLAEQRTGWLQRPLSQLLQLDLDVPLYVLSGLTPENEPRSSWPARAAAWIGFIAIIAGFFILQVKISQLPKDWTIVLELIATTVEFWLIWVWNNLFK